MNELHLYCSADLSVPAHPMHILVSVEDDRLGQWSDLSRLHCWLYNLPTSCDECLLCVYCTLYIYYQPDTHHLPPRQTSCRHRPVTAIAVACRHSIHGRLYSSLRATLVWAGSTLYPIDVTWPMSSARCQRESVGWFQSCAWAHLS